MTPNGSRSFTIQSCLGRGGFGEVFLAKMRTSSGLETEVALKVLRADIDLKDEAVKRLRDEGRLLGVLNHPAILRVLDMAHIDGRIALVTEYVPGADLDVLLANTAFPLRALLEVIGTVAEALHEAFVHPRPNGQPLRLIHRDIKPSNIRISRHGAVRLLDFGIAWSEDTEREAQTAHNSAVGSLAFMAPERFGRAAVSSSADVYSLGCVLFEGLFGERLFEGATPIEMLRRSDSLDLHDAFIQSQIERGRTHTKAPPQIIELMTSLLQFNPSNRPSADQLSEHCDTLIDSLQGPTLKRWARSHSWDGPEPLTHTWNDQTLHDTGSSSVLLTPPSVVLPPDQTKLDSSSATFAFNLDEPTNANHTLNIESAPVTTLSFTTDTTGSSAARYWPLLGLLLSIGLGGAFFLQRQPPQPISEKINALEEVLPSEVPAAPPTKVDGDPNKHSEAGQSEHSNSSSTKNSDAGPDKHRDADQTKNSGISSTKNNDIGQTKPVHTTIPSKRPTKTVPAPVVIAPIKPTTGAITTTRTSVPVQLRAEGRSYKVGALPTGRYRVWADFGAGFSQTSLTVTLLEDQTLTIWCNALKFTCALI